MLTAKQASKVTKMNNSFGLGRDYAERRHSSRRLDHTLEPNYLSLEEGSTLPIILGDREIYVLGKFDKKKNRFKNLDYVVGVDVPEFLENNKGYSVVKKKNIPKLKIPGAQFESVSHPSTREIIYVVIIQGKVKKSYVRGKNGLAK